MPITFNCPCGKILSSRERDAGLKAICPSCGRRVIVPGQIQTPPDSGEQLRKAVLKVDSWIHSQHRVMWKLSIVVGVLFLIGMIGYQLWSRRERQEIAQRNLSHFTPPPEIKLDPNADPEQWQTSFDSFAVAMKSAMARNELLEDKFTGKTIDWIVTFDDLPQRNSLYFREAEPLRHSDHGILCWATVLPSQIENAEKLKPGQKIRLTGKIGPVLKGRSAEHPLGNITVRPLECSVEVVDDASSKPEAAPAAETTAKAEDSAADDSAAHDATEDAAQVAEPTPESSEPK